MEVFTNILIFSMILAGCLALAAGQYILVHMVDQSDFMFRRRLKKRLSKMNAQELSNEIHKHRKSLLMQTYTGEEGCFECSGFEACKYPTVVSELVSEEMFDAAQVYYALNN